MATAIRLLLADVDGTLVTPDRLRDRVVLIADHRALLSAGFSARR